jgi:hypothetical protein
VSEDSDEDDDALDAFEAHLESGRDRSPSLVLIEYRLGLAERALRGLSRRSARLDEATRKGLERQNLTLISTIVTLFVLIVTIVVTRGHP